jgi:hypothetical protein
MIKTDYHADSLGNRDYVFSCHNRAFAATWSPLLPRPSETLIDLELTEFLDIPIKKIEARKFSFAGTETRVVGHISQTVQCVVNGKTSGTAHFKASVVRHLTKLFSMDCVAGGQLFKRLASSPNTPQPSPKKTAPGDLHSELNSSTSSTAPSTPEKVSKLPKVSTPNSIIFTSPEHSPIRSDQHKAWLYQNGDDDRYDAERDKPVDGRWLYDEDFEMWGLPYNSSGPLVKPDPKDNTVTYIVDKEENMIAYISALNHNWPAVGRTFPPSHSNLPQSQEIHHSTSLLPAQPTIVKLNPKSLLRAFL